MTKEVRPNSLSSSVEVSASEAMASKSRALKGGKLDDQAIDAQIIAFHEREAVLSKRLGELDRDRLEAYVEMWKQFRQWGGFDSKLLSKRLNDKKLKEGKVYKHQPYVQDFTGIYLNDIKDAKRRSNLSSHVTSIACLWAALDAKFDPAKSVKDMADEVKSIRDFTDAFKSGRQTTSSVDYEALANERLTKTAEAGVPTAVVNSGNPDLDGSVTYNVVIGGKLRMFKARSLPANVLELVSKHLAPDKLEQLDPVLGTLSDVIALSAFIPDGDSEIPTSDQMDPQAKSTTLLPAHRQILIQGGGTRIVASQARQEAGPVVAVQPKHAISGVQDGFIYSGSRKAFASYVLPHAVRTTFGCPKFEVTSKGQALKFPNLQGGREAKLRVVPMTSFGSSDRDNMWALDIDPAFAPTDWATLDGEAIATIRRELIAPARVAHLKERLAVALADGSVSLTLGKGKPLQLACAGSASGKISVLGADFVLCLKTVLEEHSLAELQIGVSAKGLLELRFQTHWASYSVFIPAVTAGKTAVRKDNALRRIKRAA